MYPIIILEGIDGTGKTTLASKIIQSSTTSLPVSYLYFPKLSTPSDTIVFWTKTFESQAIELSSHSVVILDRSVISTIVYHNLKPRLLHQLIKLPRKTTIFVLLTKMYKNKENYSQEKIKQLTSNYNNAFNVIESDGYFTLRGTVPDTMLNLLLAHWLLLDNGYK